MLIFFESRHQVKVTGLWLNKIEKMAAEIFSPDQPDAMFEIEHDWLFEKLPGRLNANKHLMLSADQARGIHGIC